MFDHIMLDLETLDTRETAVILSIGAVRFSLDELALGEEFECTVEPVSCQERGLTIGADTVRWWVHQSDEARHAAFYRYQVTDPPTMYLPIDLALSQFQAFVVSRDIKVWGNGSNFDNAILKNAYRACNLSVPWSYKNDMCFRTMMKMFPMEHAAPSGVKHHALDDARRQAQALIKVWREVGKSTVSISKTGEVRTNVLSEQSKRGLL